MYFQYSFSYLARYHYHLLHSISQNILIEIYTPLHKSHDFITKNMLKLIKQMIDHCVNGIVIACSPLLCTYSKFVAILVIITKNNMHLS